MTDSRDRESFCVEMPKAEFIFRQHAIWAEHILWRISGLTITDGEMAELVGSPLPGFELR